MSLPGIESLPDPPPGKMDWPWIREGLQSPVNLNANIDWPRLCIVSPSFNQADFLEQTIRSVLLQGYPNLEYIIIDGGSTDGSVEIIRKYKPWLSYWVSEPDRGQSHAINKGFRKCSSELMAYINSDDIYYPNALIRAVQNILESNTEILIGALDIVKIGENGIRTKKRSSPNYGTPIHKFPIFTNKRREVFQFLQPSMFWTRSIWEKTGEIDERYHYSMDREWCIRALACGARVNTSEDVFARFLLHKYSKSQIYDIEFSREKALMFIRFCRLPEFRLIPSLLESILHQMRYQQDLHSVRSDIFRSSGKNMSAALALFFSRVFRRCRLSMNLLAETPIWNVKRG